MKSTLEETDYSSLTFLTEEVNSNRNINTINTIKIENNESASSNGTDKDCLSDVKNNENYKNIDSDSFEIDSNNDATISEKTSSKRNVKKRNEKDKTQLDLAVSLVLKNKLSLRAAAHLYKIPFSTLRTRKLFLLDHPEESTIEFDLNNNHKVKEFISKDSDSYKEEELERCDEDYEFNESIENNKNKTLEIKEKNDNKSSESKRLYIRHDKLDRLFKINGEPISVLDKKNVGSIDKLLKKASNYKSISNNYSSNSSSPTHSKKTASPIKLSSLFSNSILTRPKKICENTSINSNDLKNVVKEEILSDENVLAKDEQIKPIDIDKIHDDSIQKNEDPNAKLIKSDLINQPAIISRLKEDKASKEKLIEDENNNNIKNTDETTNKKLSLTEHDFSGLKKYKKYLIKPNSNNKKKLSFKCENCKILFLNKQLLNEHDESNCHFKIIRNNENDNSNNDQEIKRTNDDVNVVLSPLDPMKYLKCNFCKVVFPSKLTFMSHISSSCNNNI